jgi:hypothetical protein
MTDVPQRSFRTGGEPPPPTQYAGSKKRIGYFSIKDGERAFVQFVTDSWEWMEMDQHVQVPTKSPPPDWQGEWPQMVSPVCRLTKMGDGLPLYDDCYVCRYLKDKDGKPWRKSLRYCALGIMREEVTNDKGQRGFRDIVTEVEVPATDTYPASVIKKPQMVIFTQSWKNFFSGLKGASQAWASQGGTICNQNFVISRSGGGIDTTYSITSLGITKRDFNNPETLAKLGIKLDMDHPYSDGQGFKVFPEEYDLHAMLLWRSSDDFYARYIDPYATAPVSKRGDDSGIVKPSHDLTTPELEELRRKMAERIMGYAEAPSISTPAPSLLNESEEEEFEAISVPESVDFDEEEA